MMTRMTLQFWGDDRLVINTRGGWQLRDWPSGDILQEGSGTASPQPGGASIAVCVDGGLSIDGELVEPPTSPVHLVRWYDVDHLLVVSGDNAAQHLPRRQLPCPPAPALQRKYRVLFGGGGEELL